MQRVDSAVSAAEEDGCWLRRAVVEFAFLGAESELLSVDLHDVVVVVVQK